MNISQEPGARWDSKLVLINKANKKQQNLAVLVTALQKNSLRLDLNGPLGYQVGIVAINRPQLYAIIYPQNRFFKGKSNDGSLNRLVNIPIPAEILFPIIFDKAIPFVGWSCTLNAQQMVERCDHAAGQVQVKWEYKEDQRKLITINSKQYELKWLFEAPEKLESIKSNLFELTPPEGFKTIQLN